MPSESHTDVLIVGAGPAGMMASMYFSEMGIPHRIIDAKGTRTLNGRADGFHIRTMEIWDSFDIAHKLHQYGAEYGEFAIWMFDKEAKARGEDPGIVLASRQDLGGLSDARLPTGTFHQGFIEAGFGDAVRARGGPKVERGTKPTGIKLEDGGGEYPVTTTVRRALMSELDPPRTGAHSFGEDGTWKRERGFVDCYGSDPEEVVQHVSGEEGSEETIRSKYVIGTDGAHSWVRHQLPDFKMEGDNTDAVFGVLDIIPLTDFPDIRKTGSILSDKGYCLLIPRELGLVRLYVQLADDYSKEGKDEQTICAEILDAARKIFAPYKMDYKYCDWHTIYKIGQRVANHCSYQDRIFLAGDAIHTHSPKGGQGMNVSQQDTYNLAWKIAGVIRNQLSPDVLSTYETERLPVAHDLIALDKDMAQVLTARANGDEAEARRIYGRLQKTNGTFLVYKANASIAKDGEQAHQAAAPGLPLGVRFPHAPVYMQSNSAPKSSMGVLKSTGQWRLCVFAGDLSKPEQLAKVNGMGDQISALSTRYPAASSKQSKWLQVLLFHSSPTQVRENKDFHDAFFPPDPVMGRDYYTIFADGKDEDKGEKGTHKSFEIDGEKGALVLVRPDQTISWVGYLDNLAMLEEFLGSFMISEKAEGLERRDSPQDKS